MTDEFQQQEYKCDWNRNGGIKSGDVRLPTQYFSPAREGITLTAPHSDLSPIDSSDGLTSVRMHAKIG